MAEVRQADIELLENLSNWLTDQYHVLLVTVIRTNGHTPRRVGTQFALREDGVFVGSVSGGCAEDELISSLLDSFPNLPMTLCFGGEQENSRSALSCGGEIELALEPIVQNQQFRFMAERIKSGQRMSRCYHLETGDSKILNIPFDGSFELDRPWITLSYGSRLRLLIIGAVEIAHYLVPMAQTLNYNVSICDPRPAYRKAWRLDSIQIDTDYPDDWLIKQNIDQYCAVITLSHDPRYDDIGLMEALPSKAFYVGALGSKRSSEKRLSRLQQLDLNPEHVKRLHAPIGLNIGSRSAAEIAVSIIGQLISEQNTLQICV